jgi:hypothetical protein
LAEAREREGGGAEESKADGCTEGGREGGRRGRVEGRREAAQREGGREESEDVVVGERDPLPLRSQRADTRSADLGRGMSIRRRTQTLKKSLTTRPIYQPNSSN